MEARSAFLSCRPLYLPDMAHKYVWGLYESANSRSIPTPASAPWEFRLD